MTPAIPPFPLPPAASLSQEGEAPPSAPGGEPLAPRRRRPNPAAPDYAGKGARDQVEAHPQRDEIDQHILAQDLTAAQICLKYGFAGEWVVHRRRAKLKKRVHERRRKNFLSNRSEKAARAEKRTLAMFEAVQGKALEGFDRVMGMAETAEDVERAATFLDKYIAATQWFGKASGEIVEGQGAGVVVDNRQMYVMSLPRGNDPPEVLEAERRALQIGPGVALAEGSREVMDLGDEEWEEQEVGS